MNKPVFLDVDPSIVENNLKVTDNNDNDADIGKLFHVPGEQYPSKLIKPVPGFCIKTKEIGSETKIFINICKTDAIPPPPNYISEDELAQLLQSDEITEYKVPMSIGDMRSEKDKKGEDAKVCDIAINDKFFVTVENSQIFKNFILAIIFEAISNKHNIFVTDERTLLRQRKTFGTLQVHRIQDRDADKTKLPGAINKPPIIEEVPPSNVSEIEVPSFILYKKKNENHTFYADINLPKVTSSNEITLDVGEDRLIIESKAKKYLLDIFIPVDIYPQKAKSFFNTATKILRIEMSIQIGG